VLCAATGARGVGEGDVELEGEGEGRWCGLGGLRCVLSGLSWVVLGSMFMREAVAGAV
jgi:hypothetical protein